MSECVLVMWSADLCRSVRIYKYLVKQEINTIIFSNFSWKYEILLILLVSITKSLYLIKF